MDAFTNARARLAWGHDEETVVKDLVRGGVAVEEAREYVQAKLQREDRDTRRGGGSGLVVSVVIGALGAVTTVYFIPLLPIMVSDNLMAQLDALGFPLCDWRVAPRLFLLVGPLLMVVGFFGALQSSASVIFGGRRDRSE